MPEPEIVEEIEVGTMTTVRRVSMIMASEFWDESETPGVGRKSATISYELMYVGMDGKQIAPPKPDGQVYVTDEDIAGMPQAAAAFEALEVWGLQLAHKRDEKAKAEAEAFKLAQQKEAEETEKRRLAFAKQQEDEAKAREEQNKLAAKK